MPLLVVIFNWTFYGPKRVQNSIKWPKIQWYLSLCVRGNSGGTPTTSWRRAIVRKCAETQRQASSLSPLCLCDLCVSGRIKRILPYSSKSESSLFWLILIITIRMMIIRRKSHGGSNLPQWWLCFRPRRLGKVEKYNEVS